MRPALRSAVTLLLAGACAGAAADTQVAELERQLDAGSVEQVNAQLGAAWAAAMVPLNRKTAGCELPAVSLALRLGRTSDPKAARAHGDALRAAAGTCPRYVLALAAPEEIGRYCASLDSWGPAQTARELRRRIAALEADDVLRTSERGRACKAAYLHELNTTRVVLKSRPKG